MRAPTAWEFCRNRVGSFQNKCTLPCVQKVMAIPHNSKCRYGERGAAAARPKAQIILDAATGCYKGERRQWRMQRTEAGAAVAECEGLLPPKHDAGTATRHSRAFWQRRCRAAAAGAVLKPQGGNCAVLPKRTGNNKSARTCNDSRYVRFLFIMCLNGKDIRC